LFILCYGRFINSLPMTDVPTKYVGFMTFERVGTGSTPAVVVFLVGADQLSALSACKLII
jgi:hypothetical protein